MTKCKYCKKKGIVLVLEDFTNELYLDPNDPNFEDAGTGARGDYKPRPHVEVYNTFARIGIPSGESYQVNNEVVRPIFKRAGGGSYWVCEKHYFSGVRV